MIYDNKVFNKKFIFLYHLNKYQFINIQKEWMRANVSIFPKTKVSWREALKIFFKKSSSK